MRRIDLVTAGDAFEDLLFLHLPRIPRPGEELKTGSFARTLGGGAVITAVAAARLGVSSAVLTGVDEAGQRRLTRERVRVINLRRRGEPIAVSAALSTRRERCFVTFTGVNDVLESRLLREVPRVQAKHVHLALQPARCRAWTPIVSALRHRGVTTSWDFGWSERLARDRSLRRLAATVDYLFVNEAEFRLYAGVRGRTTIVKLGARGARLMAEGETLVCRAPRMALVDTTGAGDAFNAGFLAGLLRDESPRECLRLGNLVGARSTTAAGGLDGLPRRRDLA